MTRRYTVSRCTEPDGTHTWDVLERAYRGGVVHVAETHAISNHATRAEAREDCAHANGCWEAIGVTRDRRGHVPPPIDSEAYRQGLRDAGRGHLVRS